MVDDDDDSGMNIFDGVFDKRLISAEPLADNSITLEFEGGQKIEFYVYEGPALPQLCWCDPDDSEDLRYFKNVPGPN